MSEPFAPELVKLRPVDTHAHLVAATDATGAPTKTAGVDLRGDDARALFTEAAPLVEALERRGGGTLRALSIHYGTGTVRVTLDVGEAKPAVVVARGDEARALLELAPSLRGAIVVYLAARLSARASGG